PMGSAGHRFLSTPFPIPLPSADVYLPICSRQPRPPTSCRSPDDLRLSWPLHRPMLEEIRVYPNPKTDGTDSASLHTDRCRTHRPSQYVPAAHLASHHCCPSKTGRRGPISWGLRPSP